MKKLYIPVNIRKRKELIPGYGGKEVIYTLIGAAFGIVFSVIFTIMGKDVLLCMLSPVVTGGIVTMVVIKDKMNTSVVDSVQYIIQYFKEQQKFEYCYHNIYERENIDEYERED